MRAMELGPDVVPGLPEVLPGFLAQAFLAALRAENLDISALPASTSQLLSQSDRSAFAVATADIQALLEAACRAAHNPHLGLSIGKHITEANLPVLGPVFVTSPSFRMLAEQMSGLQVAVFGDYFWGFTEEDGEHAIYATLQEIPSQPLTEMVLALAFGCAKRFAGERHSRGLVALFTTTAGEMFLMSLDTVIRPEDAQEENLFTSYIWAESLPNQDL